MLNNNYSITLNFVIVQSFPICNIILIKVLLMNKPIYSSPNWLFCYSGYLKFLASRNKALVK